MMMNEALNRQVGTHNIQRPELREYGDLATADEVDKRALPLSQRLRAALRLLHLF